MSNYSGFRSLLYIFMLILSSFTSKLDGISDIVEVPGYQEEHSIPGYAFEGEVLKVEEPDKPAMVSAWLEDNKQDAYLRNTYDIDYMSRDVVGMVGVPIEVCTVTDHLQEPMMLVFEYDDTKLECDEEDLGVLWYNTTDYWYETQENVEIDTEKNTVSVAVLRQGTYILEDMKTWISVWNGTYVYKEEELPQEPDCHWHDEFVYEDIEALADTEFFELPGPEYMQVDGEYVKVTAEYHITRIEELAGLVKLVNEGNSFYGCDFYLDADLDLAGYEWAPIGWHYPADNGYYGKDFPFEGRFYGNGHAIYNMRIVAPDQSDLGMFGRTLQSFEVHDLALIDCYIEGKYYVGGMLGDNINSGEDFDMTGCFVSGTVKGKLKSGALVGSSAYLRMQDCYGVMTEDSIQELTGDLRGGYIENCSINDATALEALAEYEKDETVKSP